MELATRAASATTRVALLAETVLQGKSKLVYNGTLYGLSTWDCRGKISSGLYYKSFTIIIYYHNDSD